MIFILFLLTIGLTSILISFFRGNLQCLSPRVIYRFIPKHELDVVFGNENYPSEIYRDMFVKNSVFRNNTYLGDEKAFTALNEQESTIVQ